MELHELIRMTTLINRLAKRALFAEEQIVALEGQCAEWKRIADELKAERNAAKQEAVSARQDAVTRAEADRKRIDGLMIQAQDMRAEIERLKKPRQHPVKVGEWVRRTDAECESIHWGLGVVAQVMEVYSAEQRYNVTRPDWNGDFVPWDWELCTPCDPPEATHITPDGKATAQAAVTPQPGDVVRLVRVPTNDEYPHDSGRWEPNWGGIGDYMRVHYVGSNINGTRVVRAVFGLEWPLSCIEVVKGGDK